MLVLSRKKNEEVVIEDVVIVRVIEIRGDKVRLGFEAPKDVSVHRREVYDAIQNERARAAQSGADGAVPPVHAPSEDYGAQLDSGTVGPSP